jgi:hypothetical protein
LTGREEDGRRADAGAPDARNPTDLSPTQALPLVVRLEGLASAAPATPEPPAPAVRAVARRVPSALPAIGRDEISDVPASARATADRRRRAREAAAGVTESGAEPGEEPA